MPQVAEATAIVATLAWQRLAEADLPALTHLARRCLSADGGLPLLAGEPMLRKLFLSGESIGGRDETGDLQIMLTSELADLPQWKTLIDLGDQVGVTGEVMTTRSGELTVRAASWRLTAKCLHPLPAPGQEAGAQAIGDRSQPQVQRGRLHLFRDDRRIGRDHAGLDQRADAAVGKNAVHAETFDAKTPTPEQGWAFSKWSGRRDSNSRPSAPQTDALTRLRHGPTRIV